MKSVIKRLRFPLEVMLVCVRRYIAYPLSLRNLEEMMQECGVRVDYSTIHRWTLRLMPVLKRTFRKRKAAVGTRWQMDETFVKVGGQLKYLYRAVDKAGNTVDFLLTAKRDRLRHNGFSLGPSGTTRFPQPSVGSEQGDLCTSEQAWRRTLSDDPPHTIPRDTITRFDYSERQGAKLYRLKMKGIGSRS